MLATLEQFDRVPRILRLNVAGQPVDWMSWREAVGLYVRELVILTWGDAILRLRGGHSRSDGTQSRLDLHSIVMCRGRIVEPSRSVPPLTNTALFKRDRNICLYCGGKFIDFDLTRDHIVPLGRGGVDRWDNCVAACKRCNHFKGGRLPHECGLELIALPYVPNFAEYLALTNEGRILADQMDFLKTRFGKESRLLV